VVIFGINHGYVMVDNLFESIHSGLDELCISYGLYKENTKSNELLAIYCVQ